MARPKQPKAVKAIKGTLRPCRETPSMKLLPGAPEAPGWLQGEGLTEFRRVTAELEASGILAPADRGPLVAYCVLWAKFVETAQGKGDINVALVVEMRRLGALFGLSPADREKLPPKPKQDGGPSKWSL